MVGQGCATCHDEAHMAPEPGLDLAEHQLVKEWRRLQTAAEADDQLMVMVQERCWSKI